MKTLVKLVLVAVIANATWHVFTVYSAHYKFKDAIEYAAENRGQKSDADLRLQVLEMAAQAELPIDEDRLTVVHEGSRTTIDGGYTRSIELFPGFLYPWTLTLHVDAYPLERRALNPLTKPK
jgi:hypothetical protein